MVPVRVEGVAAAAVIGCRSPQADGRGGPFRAGMRPVPSAWPRSSRTTPLDQLYRVDLQVWAGEVLEAPICCVGHDRDMANAGAIAARLAMGGLTGLLAIGLLGALWFGRVQLGTMHELVRIIIGGVALSRSSRWFRRVFTC